MTKPTAMPNRRPVRASPRLPRGPKPSNGQRASSQPGEQSGSGLPGGKKTVSPSGRTTEPMVFPRDSTGTLPVKEAAFRLGKSEDTVLYWLRKGRLLGWQLGGPRCAIRVSEESVEQVLLRASEFSRKGPAAGQS